jgi:hypothetical protein
VIAEAEFRASDAARSLEFAGPGVEPVAVHTMVGAPVVSARVADWSRESKSFWSWHPSRSLLASLRAYERASGGRSFGAAVSRKLAVLRHRFWSIVTGADIPLGCRLGGGTPAAASQRRRHSSEGRDRPQLPALPAGDAR